jgi:hypothetical protein
MAMGGTGAAASTKFNASFHNPALIAFNRGVKPDRIYISASQGLRELYDQSLAEDVFEYQDSNLQNRIDEDLRTALGEQEGVIETLTDFRNYLRDKNMSSYRRDDTSAFSILVDTLPVTLNFFIRRDIREMSVIRNRDEQKIQNYITAIETDADLINFTSFNSRIESTVDNTYFDISEFGVTVATTNVIEYNMPISWGLTPKIFEMNGSHIATPLNEYEPDTPPERQVSRDLIEWNLDIGYSMLLTDAFLSDGLGIDGWALGGEWIFSFVGMNIFPTDFTPFKPARPTPRFPGTKRAIQALYQLGVAHYREDYMLTMDIDLTENEVYDFEGLTRFLSMGGEYYWRDDFHLRAGLRLNLAQTEFAAKDQAVLTGGFIYQPNGFNIEGAFMINDVEQGATLGFGLAF